MNRSPEIQKGPETGSRLVFRRLRALSFGIVLLLAAAVLAGGILYARADQVSDDFKIGERLTYTISFNNFDSAAYAEIRVVSRGKLDGKSAVELFGKLRSSDVLSAAFYLWDEERTTYVSPETGYPLLIREVSKTGLLPKETVSNFLKEPSSNLDLLSLIYKARQSGGNGSYNVLEAGKIYSFNFSPAGGRPITTEAGTFETNLFDVQSEYFAENGIRDFVIAFSADSRTLPVTVQFRTEKGEFEARLASVQDLTPEPTVTVTPAPTTSPTPVVTPEPTPQPYVDNRPLSTDLPFELGETLRYRVQRSGSYVGEVNLKAAERKLFQGRDALLLTAQVLSLGPSNDLFAATDRVDSWVDPDTLAPIYYSINLAGGLSRFSQSAGFNQADGTVLYSDGKSVQVPVGTHNIISLAFAVRAFNLRPNLDPNSPVNDTRVAVLLGDAPLVLTLRPSAIEPLEIGGVKRQAQMISVRGGTPEIDGLNIRFWLSADGRRIPLKLAVGQYIVELESAASELSPPAGTSRTRITPGTN